MLTIKRTIYQQTIVLLLAGCASFSNISQAEPSTHYREPVIPIPQDSETDELKVTLGERLFTDTRLSKNHQIACSSCHQLDAGGDDNVAIGISISGGQHIVNTPSIFNARYNFRQNWDGSAKSLSEQIEMVINNHHEFDNRWNKILSDLKQDSSLKSAFNNIYPDGISKANILDALVEFEKSLITPNSRFDRYLNNEDDVLTAEEIKGYQTFKNLGCISCHQGINLGGNLYQKFGVFYDYIAERGNIRKSDYGRMNTTKRLIDAYVFKVPSLRNIAVTSPYLHDGSIETMEEAISIMGKTQLGRTLTNEEVSLIKSFLLTLTGEYKNKPLDSKS